ncbi:MAG: hypothetical protein H7Y20_12215 [Bryobacteraceae bacterium]|nr:hypothetical protein [Bryobacteraceae bacterium]
MLDAAHQAIARLRKPNVRRVLLLISESRDRGSESELGQVLSAAHVAGVSVYAATYSAMKTAFTTKGPGNEMPRESAIPRPNRTEPLSAQGRVPIPADSQRMDILGGIGELVRMGKTKDTEVLTTGTGGTTFPFTRLKGLENAITHLGEELHSQYILSFAPATPTAGYHRLEVRLTRQGNFRIRSRPGYWWTQ